MAKFKEGRALLIGISDYKTKAFGEYQQTAEEARAIGAALKQASVAGYDVKRVRVLSKKVTLGQIEKEFRNLADASTPDDTVFIYLASHGDKGTDNDYYFLTSDAVYLDQEKRIKADTGLSGKQLKALLRKINAKKVLIMINTCYSGSVRATLSAKAEPRGKPFRAELLATGRGRAVITACSSSQESHLDTKAPLTYFGQAVLDALKGKLIFSPANVILLGDLFDSISDSVGEIPDLDQDPVLSIPEQIGKFPVAFNPKPIKIPAPSRRAPGVLSFGGSRAMEVELAPDKGMRKKPKVERVSSKTLDRINIEYKNSLKNVKP